VIALDFSAAALALLAAGYAIGRVQPIRRAFDWANWQNYGRRPTGLRYAAMYAVLSAENIGWLIAHPRRGWHAWKHRTDRDTEEA
jgi:hypothetical protein